MCRKGCWISRGVCPQNIAPLRPQAIVKTLRDVLPPESIVVVDGGNFAKFVRRHFDIFEADTFQYPDDFGSVGASFPMALGVKVGKPKTPVVCLCGDGGFLLNCQELETAVRERINVLTVVFNDYGFGNVRAYQKAKFEERYMCDFDNPPFGEMARLFKAEGRNVETLDTLKEAVQAGLKSDKPYVIDVRMTGEELGKPGCSERLTDRLWNNGVMECWKDGVFFPPIIPVFHRSNSPGINNWRISWRVVKERRPAQK